MADKKKSAEKKTLKSLISKIAGIIVVLILAYFTADQTGVIQTGNDSTETNGETLEVHYIDVGQGDSIFIKWIIKALCGVILVANTYYIASALFSFGTNVCTNGLTTLFGSGGDYLSSALAIKKSALSSLGLGELMTVWFISLIVHLGIMILIVAIVITLASRIIEIFMYLSIAPITMATMMDSGEWASVGKNWIKQLLALSFQGFFIVVALAIFKTLFNNMITSLNSSSDGVIMQMAMLMGYTAALIFTVLRTGAMSKSIFNAR